MEQGLHWSDTCIAPNCIAVGLTPVLADRDDFALQMNYAILKLPSVKRLPSDLSEFNTGRENARSYIIYVQYDKKLYVLWHLSVILAINQLNAQNLLL